MIVLDEVSNFPNVIDLASVRARRGDYLGRLRPDRHKQTAIAGGSSIEPARAFTRFDTVEDRASGRRGIVAETIGRDHYAVMFYTGRADDEWRVTRWGFQLRLIMTGQQTIFRAFGVEPEPPPPPAA